MAVTKDIAYETEHEAAYVARIVHFPETEHLPRKKINIIFQGGVTMVAYIPVTTLPSPAQAEEGVFYILPDDSLNYIVGGSWKKILPDGEDNTIDHIKDAYGNELLITNKTVTLPSHLPLAFEDIYVNSKAVGWRVRNDITQNVIYSHYDMDTKSDGTYYTSTALDVDAGNTTSVLASSVTGLDTSEVVVGETLIYDEDGTLGVVTANDGTTLTVTTITANDLSDGVHLSSVELDPTIGNTSSLTLTNIGLTSNHDLVVGESLIYDNKGTVGVLTAAAGNAINVKTITNTVDYQSDGAYKCSITLPTEVDDTEVISIGNIPEITDIEHCVINETLIYDEDGTVAKVTAIDSDSQELTVKVITADSKNPPVFYYDGQLNPLVNSTVSVDRTDLFRIADKTTVANAKELIVNKTLISDQFGSVGVVTAFANQVATVETIATDTSPYIIKVSNMLDDTVGNTKAINFTDLKNWHDTAVDEQYLLVDKTLVVDIVRSCIGLITYTANSVATVTTIYSSDAPFVFETTTYSLPDLGTTNTDQSISTYRTQITRLDNSSKYLEEYEIIAGKTTIYNRLEGRIAVITKLDSNNGTFDIKTIYEGKSGNVIKLDGGYGRCANTVNFTASIDRVYLYSAVSDMVIGKDIIYDTEGNIAYLESYDSTNDKVTLRTIHTTYPETNIVISTNTLLSRTIGGQTTITYTDVQGSTLDHTSEPFHSGAFTVSDRLGTIGIVTARDTTASPVEFTVKTISTAGGDPTIYTYIGNLDIKPEGTVTVASTDITTQTTIDLSVYESGKTLITDWSGTLAVVSGPDLTNNYIFKTITSGAKDVYAISSGTLLNKTINETTTVDASAITGLNNLSWYAYQTKVYDTDGTVGVVTLYSNSTSKFTVKTISAKTVPFPEMLYANGLASSNQWTILTDVDLSSTTLYTDTALTTVWDYANEKSNPDDWAGRIWVYDAANNALGYISSTDNYDPDNNNYLVDIVFLTRTNPYILMPAVTSNASFTPAMGLLSVANLSDFTVIDGSSQRAATEADIITGKSLIVDRAGTVGLVISYDSNTGELEIITLTGRSGAYIISTVTLDSTVGGTVTGSLNAALSVGDLVIDANRRVGVVESQNFSGARTTYKTIISGFGGAASSSDGTLGLVTKPVAGDQGKFLRGDSTWQFENTISTSNNVSVSSDTPQDWVSTLESSYPLESTTGWFNRTYLTSYLTASTFTNQPTSSGTLETIMLRRSSSSSLLLYQFWYGGDGTVLYRMGGWNGWITDSTGAFEDLGGSSTIWRTTAELDENQDHTASITTTTFTDPTGKKTYSKAKIGDLVVDDEMRLGQITALSGTTATVTTLLSAGFEVLTTSEVDDIWDEVYGESS